MANAEPIQIGKPKPTGSRSYEPSDIVEVYWLR